MAGVIGGFLLLGLVGWVIFGMTALILGASREEVREMKSFIAMNKEPPCDKHITHSVYFEDTNQTVIKCVKCDRVFERIEWKSQMNQATSDWILSHREG